MAANEVCFKFAIGLDCDVAKYIYKYGIITTEYYDTTHVRATQGPAAIAAVALYASEMSGSEHWKHKERSEWLKIPLPTAVITKTNKRSS